MRRSPASSVLPLLQSFFLDHLRRVRGASEHTIRAYRDSLRLFFCFLANHLARSIADLRLDDVSADSVLAFLQQLESERGNTVATRNCRLAAIRSFADHLLRHDLTRAQQYGRILALPAKRAPIRVVPYLEPEDVRAVIAATDGPTAMHRRDRALLLFLYNSGARVSEALALRGSDLQMERPRQVRLLGKGGKQRICPLWAETITSLRTVVRDGGPDKPLFCNARGIALTRDGVAYIIRKYVARAAALRPILRRQRVTPHVFRHSCAVALLQAGVDVCVIRDYLGHASIATTSRYVTTNLQMKRDVLQAFWAKAGLDHSPTPRCRPSPKLLAFLESL